MTESERRKYSRFLEEVKAREVLEESASEAQRERHEKSCAQKAMNLYLKWKCLTDLYFLGTKILDMASGKKKRIRERIDPKFHKWLTSVMSLNEDKMILVPRDHLKSTWLKILVVQEILKDPNTSIVLSSRTKSLVVQQLDHIKRLLASPKLRALFPDQIPEPGKDYANWEKATQQELTVKRRPDLGFVPQGPQVLACGVGATITGYHFKRAFLDDVLNEKTVTTAEQIQKTVDWWGYLQPMMEEDSITTVIGTPYHYLDLYAVIQRERHIDKIFKRAAIENGKPIYAFHTMKYYEKMKRRLSLYQFSCQYMIDPTPTEEKIFPPPQPTYTELPPGTYKYYIAIDPAATTKNYSDSTGLVVAAVNERNWLFIVEGFKVKLPPNKLADLIIAKQIQYRPVRIGIELGLQAALRYLVEMKVSQWEGQHGQKLGLSIMEIPISRTKSKAQRIAATFGAFIRDGKCRIKETCSELLTEMGMYSGKDSDEDNLVDAASMIFSCVENFAQHYWVEPQFRKPYTLKNLLESMRAKENKWEKQFVQA
jgi:hypothetical protein